MWRWPSLVLRSCRAVGASLKRAAQRATAAADEVRSRSSFISFSSDSIVSNYSHSVLRLNLKTSISDSLCAPFSSPTFTSRHLVNTYSMINHNKLDAFCQISLGRGFLQRSLGEKSVTFYTHTHTHTHKYVYS